MINLFNIKYLFIFILYIKIQPYYKIVYIWKTFITIFNFVFYYIKQLLILYNKYKCIIGLFIIKNMNLFLTY